MKNLFKRFINHLRKIFDGQVILYSPQGKRCRRYDKNYSPDKHERLRKKYERHEQNK